MATPPEVLSAELNSGAGAGPMSASALHQSWLGIEYHRSALEIEIVLEVVKYDGWEGETAEVFVNAYMALLRWLVRAAADHADVSARQEAVAAAYAAAVAAMPTRLELAANRVMHGVLVATNFFGINAIPLTVNEDKYAAMWIQAATTMTAYEATSKVVLASVPQIDPPPVIRTSDVLIEDFAGSEDDGDYRDYYSGDSDDDLYSHVGHATAIDEVSGGRIAWDPYHGLLNGVEYDDYVYPGQPIWWLARGVEYLQHGEHFGDLLSTDPTAAFQFLLGVLVLDLPTHIAQIATWLVEPPQLLMIALGGAVTNLGAVTGLAGLSGLDAGPSAAIPDVAPALAAAPAMSTVAGGTWTSDFGAESLGFAGTVRKETVVEVAGLITLAGDEFGGGPTIPMVPGTWTPDLVGLGESR